MLKKLLKELRTNQVNRGYFFQRVREICAHGSIEHRLIENAYGVAKDAHREQFRRSGERYFEHPRAVSLIMLSHLRIRNPYAIAAGLVHDVPEDCKRWPIERLHEVLGREVAGRVDWGNRRRFDHIPNEREQHRRYAMSLLFEAPREVAEWKLPDRLHNLITLWDASPEAIENKAEETEVIYLRLAEKHGILIHELEEAIWALRKGKHLLPPPALSASDE